jgi:hypothetical protein
MISTLWDLTSYDLSGFIDAGSYVHHVKNWRIIYIDIDTKWYDRNFFFGLSCFPVSAVRGFDKLARVVRRPAPCTPPRTRRARLITASDASPSSSFRNVSCSGRLISFGWRSWRRATTVTVLARRWRQRGTPPRSRCCSPGAAVAPASPLAGQRRHAG